jgi:hypothetical protein
MQSLTVISIRCARPLRIAPGWCEALSKSATVEVRAPDMQTLICSHPPSRRRHTIFPTFGDDSARPSRPAVRRSPTTWHKRLNDVGRLHVAARIGAAAAAQDPLVPRNRWGG